MPALKLDGRRIQGSRQISRTLDAHWPPPLLFPGVEADITALPGLLDRVDQLLADGTLTRDRPNAATLQTLAAVRVLDAFTDLRSTLRARPAAEAAHELFPQYPAELPAFFPVAWL